jgi:uroporphyrin-III C-methyltransferase/precorrin-2 dehydrogenase/sirohydrochlorin ferrochelatase
MSARRPLLLEALNELYRDSETAGRQGPGLSIEATHAEAAEPDVPAEEETAEPLPARGHVSLVGAGPGDPGLLTRHAIARLRKADLVLYDALVDERVLRIARRAQRFFVGKRAGRHTLSQQDIHAAMIGAAHRGRRVVRLKGGDPFVFGRGGEEALALIAAGVPFDVVPGVTSAVAAPALAGVPVTHRGVASAFLVVSGHDPEAFAASVRGLPTKGITLVVLMGLARRAELGRILLDQGWTRSLPAALIAEASSPRQEAWRGTLGALADGTAGVGSEGPALVVVGEVAAMALTHAEVARPRVAPAPDAEQASPGAYPAGNRG